VKNKKFKEGWSVVLHEGSDFFHMAQGLTRDEAIALGKMIFERDKTYLMVDVLDPTGTTQVYWSASRPNGFGLEE